MDIAISLIISIVCLLYISIGIIVARINFNEEMDNLVFIMVMVLLWPLIVFVDLIVWFNEKMWW